MLAIALHRLLHSDVTLVLKLKCMDCRRVVQFSTKRIIVVIWIWYTVEVFDVTVIVLF